MRNCSTLPAISLVLWASLQVGLARDSTVRIPFHFQGRNVAREPTVQTVILKEGTQETAAGKALLLGVQARQLSISNLPEGVNALRPHVRYRTGQPVPVTTDLVKEHNRQFAKLQLPPDRSYAVSYQVSFNVSGREAIFNIESDLYSKGSHSEDWIPYRKDYSGDFWAKDLIESFVSAFKNQSISDGKP